MLNEKHLIICENLDWSVNDDGETLELRKYSPAGEDFSFTVDKENFVDNVKECSADFDIDEHIKMWIEAKHNGVAGVPSTRELVKDAEDISEMLKDLASVLLKAELK